MISRNEMASATTQRSLSENELAKIIIDCAFQIHRKLGPGLYESVYEEILFHELEKYELEIKRQHPISVIWDDIKLDKGFRADLIVNNKVLVEIKSIEAIAQVHWKQTLTYLKLADLKLGLLMNFNNALLKDGIRRIVNNL